jgi:hypothetical protein
MNSTTFDKRYKDWLDIHLTTRKGESKRKLISGHGYAEKEFLRHIWWPTLGHFEYLHPEYEVMDFFDGKRYLDFAYIRSGVYIAIEVDPYGTHHDKLDRRQYSNQWVRHMHLLNDSWLIVRISLDDVKERPRLWQQLLQQMIGRLFADNASASYELSSRERDILRMAFRLDRPIKLADVQLLLQCGYDTARKQIHLLEKKKWRRC